MKILNPKCEKCGKPINRSFRKHANSFDLYHPKCFEKSEIRVMCIDEAKEMTNKEWKILEDQINLTKE